MNEQLSQEILEQLIKKEPDESIAAYSAFTFWALLHPSERNRTDSYSRAAEYAGLDLATVIKYRSENSWTERAVLVDAHLAKVQFQKRMDLLKEHNVRFANKTKEIQEKALTVSLKALDAADNLLETYAMANKVVESEWKKVVQPDGSIKAEPMKTVIEMTAKVSDIAPLIKAAIDTPAKIIGLPTEVVESDLVISGDAVEKLTDEQLAEKRAEIAREKARLGGKTQNIPGVQ